MPKSRFMTVRRNGLWVMLDRDVAMALNISEGQNLTRDEMLEAVGANARHMSRECKRAIAAAAKENPDG